jgi:hypothetical protein
MSRLIIIQSLEEPEPRGSLPMPTTQPEASPELLVCQWSYATRLLPWSVVT